MQFLSDLVSYINGVVWGPLMLLLILGTGLYLMLGLSFLPFRNISYGFRLLWQGRQIKGEGDIPPFNALMTSLSATIGTGNIAGVATAIFLGGPGALFWMWCTALVGMATKYAEAVLAVKYREVDSRGMHIGGPMFYIKNGLKPHWSWLGTCFALFGAFAGFGIGNTIQANSVADVINNTFNLPHIVTGAIITILAALVLIGGIKRIASVAGKLVPLMAFSYIGAGLLILIINYAALPQTFSLIITHAFTPAA
ncbi:MAG: alanine:cation symporter family protein, partial [Gammaproteobacteria bacterium]|nr:alanine:cation symporter family protein [Gammaproteobacteria bacterium]